MKYINEEPNWTSKSRIIISDGHRPSMTDTYIDEKQHIAAIVLST